MREVSCVGTYLAVQWLRLCASTAGVLGLIPDQRTMSHGMAKKIFLKMHAVWKPSVFLSALSCCSSLISTVAIFGLPR